MVTLGMWGGDGRDEHILEDSERLFHGYVVVVEIVHHVDESFLSEIELLHADQHLVPGPLRDLPLNEILFLQIEHLLIGEPLEQVSVLVKP